MSTSMPWIKLYGEMLDDVKMARLTDAQKWRFVQLLLLAGECDDDGVIAMSNEDIAWRLRVSLEVLEDDLQVLEHLGLVEFDDTSCFIPKFESRQGRSQSERRAQWNARQQKQRGKSVTRDSRVTHAYREDIDIDKSREEEELKSGASAAPEAEKEDDCLSEFTEITGHRPRKAQHDAIIAVMSGIQRTDRVAYLRTYWQEWSTRGYNPYGLAWLTEWARDGTIPAQRKGVEAVVVDDTAQRYKYTRGKFAAWGER